MTQYKSYKLVTIQDITKVLTDKNIDNFLVNFKMWLSMRIEFKKVEKVGDIVKFDNTRFTWIDDGKHEADFRVKVNFENKAK